jgi:hypothetical protein
LFSLSKYIRINSKSWGEFHLKLCGVLRKFGVLVNVPNPGFHGGEVWYNSHLHDDKKHDCHFAVLIQNLNKIIVFQEF